MADQDSVDFLSGGGDLGALMRAHDWTQTSLGPPARWPHSLKTCVRIMLTSRQPIWVWWGPDLINLYNDAYKSVIGGKHPKALGQPARQVWHELWPVVSERIEAAMRGEATYSEAEFLVMERHGYREETYYTFSFSPIPNDDGTPGGIICFNTDDTERVLAERRMALSRELSAGAWKTTSLEDGYAAIGNALATDQRDITFALLYEYDAIHRRAVLKSASGLAPGHRAAPKFLLLEDEGAWPAGDVLRGREKHILHDLPSRFGDLPGGSWDTPTTRAAILPLSLSPETGMQGILIAGLNPLRPLDQPFQDFLALIASQITSMLSALHAQDQEHRRAEALVDLNRVRQASADMLREETQTLETINRIGRVIAGNLDLERVVQAVTDAATEVSGAEFGAFFYNVKNSAGESYMLFALSGAKPEDFNFGMPRNTAVFAPTFAGAGIVRSADITKDARYGKNAPHHGMPKGHLPVVSYLAVPVISRSGDVIGGLFFGHKDAGVFTERAERLVAGIAAQAAVAMDNAQLFRSAQSELEQRRRIEAHQKLLLDELNHRVKNTLATVQAVAAQTLRGVSAPVRDSFIARLFALSSQHDLLTVDNWEGASLEGVVRRALKPYQEENRERFVASGPPVQLEPKRALALGMAFHELATNAAKYGALSVSGGTVRVTWATDEMGRTLTLRWQESGGPPVTPPAARGFGTRLIERGLAREISGVVKLEFNPSGVVCEWTMPL